MPIITITANSGGTFTGVEDNELYSFTPTVNQSTAAQMETTSWQASPLDDRVTLIRFPGLSNIPAGSTINSVTLTLRLNNNASANITMQVSAFRALRDWTNAGSTWNTFDGSTGWGSAGARGAGTDRASAASFELVIDPFPANGTFFNWTGPGMVADVQAWVDGAANNGWVLDRTPVGAYDFRGFTWASSDAVDTWRPVLTVDYTEAPAGPGVQSVTQLGAAPIGAGPVGVGIRVETSADPVAAVGQVVSTDAPDFASGVLAVATAATGLLREQPDRFSSAGATAAQVAVLTSEAPDALSSAAVGAVSRSANSTAQEGPETLGSAATVSINAQANSLDDREPLLAAGSVGTAAQTVAPEQADGAFSNSSARAAAVAALIDRTEASFASGGVQVLVQAQSHEASQNGAATAAAVVAAAAAGQEQSDSAATFASLQMPAQALAALPEEADSVGASALVVAARQASANLLEQGLPTVAAVQVALSAQSGGREAVDSAIGLGGAIVQASAQAVDQPDGAVGAWVVPLQLAAVVREAADLAAVSVQRLLLAAGAVLEAGDLVFGVATGSIEFAPHGRRSELQRQESSRAGTYSSARPSPTPPLRPTSTVSLRLKNVQRTRR